MKRFSLRLRLITAGVIAIMVALAVAGTGLVFLFERHVDRNMTDELDIDLKQLLQGLDVGGDGRLVVRRQPADPRYDEPLSGLYWQVTDDRGQMLRSRSLWDTTLGLPVDEPGPSEVHQHEISGPGDTQVLVAERMVQMNAGGGILVRAAVAMDLARVSAAVRAFAKDLATALLLLAIVLAIATTIQVNLGLRPLSALRHRIADIRAGRSKHLAPAAPAEVAPLVEEVNALLDAQEREIARSRGRAADLAHGLKTPLAALLADAARLRGRGEAALATGIEAAANTMNRFVDRELALARVRGSDRIGSESTEFEPLINSLVATLARTPCGERVRFETLVAEDLRLPIDRTDLAEVLGNLLENAAQHARTRVRITAAANPPTIVIEDDGMGIPESQIARALERGGRLDEQAPGSGLGLSIAKDVLDVYGWQLGIGRSELGGAMVTIGKDGDPAKRTKPAQAGAPAPAQEL